MREWSFLTNHARVLVCIAHDPGVRLRDIAATLDITERSVFGIVTDLITAGYVTKEKDGRRNRYQIQGHLPLPEPWVENDRSVRYWRSWSTRARPPRTTRRGMLSRENPGRRQDQRAHLKRDG